MTSRPLLAVGSWNIGGGILGESHQIDGRVELDYHINQLQTWAPDVLCLQEAHEYYDGRPGQASTIAKAVGYEHIHTQPISPSHLDPSAQLSISIMSRYPLSEPRYTQFPNPGFSARGPNGEHWVLFDKGYLVIKLSCFDRHYNLVNAHCFPLHYFGASATDEQFESMWEDFSRDLYSLAQRAPTIAAIDLNHEPIDELLGSLLKDGGFTNAYSRTPTIPKGLQQDYFLYADEIVLSETSVTPTHADHHYCQARFIP